MAKFTTRVELHGADSEDYEILHEEMENQGFSRTITSDEGIIYQLPEAEYNIEGDFEIEQILAAAKTGKEFGVLVSLATKRKWYGLVLST